MEFPELLDYIAQNGFAIAACIYMMVVNNKTVQKNTEATNKMISVMESVLARLGNGGGFSE